MVVIFLSNFCLIIRSLGMHLELIHEICSYLPSINCNQDFIDSLDFPGFITPCTRCVSGPYQMHVYVHVCGRPS